MLDLTGRRLLSYDLMGNLKKVASLFFLYHDMAILGDDILCLTESAYNRFSDIIDLSRLVLTDKMGKPIRRGFPITEMIRDRFTYGDDMTQYKDKAYFTDLLSDTIWEVSGKEMAPILNMTKRKPKIQQGRKGEYDGPYLRNAPCKAATNNSNTYFI